MNKKLMRKKLALMLANLKKKRKYYCELEYLESTGTQYIDTGVIPNNTSGFKIVHTICDNNNLSNILIGSRESSGDTRYWINLDWGASQYKRIEWGFNGYTTANGGVNIYILDNSKVGKTITTTLNYMNDRKGMVDDHDYSNDLIRNTTLSSFTRPVYLFCTNNQGTATYFTSCKVFSLIMTKGSEIVRDFIPVLDWNYVPCMYDKVSGELFYNQGTGDFLYGREIHPVEYLESNGTQYIVSNLRLNGDGYSIKAKFDNTDTPDGTTAFGYQLNSNNSAFQIMVIGNVSTSSTGSIFWNGTQTASPNRNMPNVMQKGLNEISITADNGTLTYTLNGASPVSYQTYTSFSPEADSNVWLFGSSRIYNHQLSTTKFYYFKVEQNGNKICDYIPAIDENGVGFMFDRVTHTCFLNSGSGVFKYPAREMEYLEGTGTQYINTGLNYWADFEIGVKLRENASNVCISNGQLFRLQRNNAENPYWVFTGGKGNTYISNIPITEYHTIKWKNLIISVDGAEITTLQKQLNSGYTLYMFANENALPYPNMIYFCKLWNPTDGTLVRDFVPAFKDGVAGFLNKIDGTFYQNSGTGSFAVGRIVEPEYE